MWTKRQKATAYRKAAKFLEENPTKWGRLSLYDPSTDTYCALGAFYKENGLCDPEENVPRYLRDEEEIMYRSFTAEADAAYNMRVHLGCLPRGGDLVRLNDTAENVGQVIKFMRNVARLLDHGGALV